MALKLRKAANALRHAHQKCLFWQHDQYVKFWLFPKVDAFLFVDETGNEERGSGKPFYIGATGVAVRKCDLAHFHKQTGLFKKTLPKAARKLEIHSAPWVNKQGALKPLQPWQRIRALRGYMRASSTCPEMRVINVIADSQALRPLGANLREEVFMKLFTEFEIFLNGHNATGLVLIDRNQIPAIQALAKTISSTIPRQPLQPTPVDSKRFPAVQLADVCAYFMLQQVSPNAHIRKASAVNAINDIAAVCSDRRNPNIAVVHQV